MVYRIYVEKKPGFDVEAEGLEERAGESAGGSGPDGAAAAEPVRRRGGIDEALFEQCASTVFSEPPVDKHLRRAAPVRRACPSR